MGLFTLARLALTALIALFCLACTSLQASEQTTIQAQAPELELVEEYLYFDAFVDKRPQEHEVEIYTEDFSQYFVAIEALNPLLTVKLTVDENTISGWFFYQNNQVEGRFDQQQINIGDKTLPLGQTDIIKREDQYYLNADTIKRWFEITVQVSKNQLAVNFDTNGKHPFLQALRRKAQWSQIDAYKIEQNNIARYDNQYQWGTWPVSDIRLTHSMTGNKATGLVTTAVFDALKHSVDWLATVSNNQNQYRFSAQREATIGGHDINYEIGDVYFPASKFLRASFGGRGFAVHGNPLSRTQARNFQVEGLPGWEVELYQGHRLIDYNKLDERGQYTFNSIDINTGFNNYTARLYGPNGEIKEQHFDFTVSNLGLYQGKWLPEFYYIEPNVPTFGHSTVENPQFDKIAVGQLNYGLSNHINIGFGSLFDLSTKHESTPYAQVLYVDKTQKVDIGLAAPQLIEVEGTEQSELSAPYSSMPYAFDYATQTDWGAFRLSKFKSYLFSQNNFQSGATLSWQYGFDDINLSAGLGKQTTNNLSNTEFNFDAGMQYNNHYLNAQLNYRTKDDYSLTTLARLSINQQLVQFKASYNKLQTGATNQFNIAWRKHFGQHNLVFNGSFITNTQQFTLSADYSGQFDGYNLGARVSRNTANEWALTLSFSTAFAWDAPSQSQSRHSYQRSAQIKTRAYWDKNNNQTFDALDEPLPGIRYLGTGNQNNAQGQKQSNANGQTVLYGIQSFYPQYLEVDTSKLDNPFLTPRQEKFRITSHPGGKIDINIPFYLHYELEGDVKTKNGKNLTGVANVPVLLMQDDKVVLRVLSEFDGYYIFDSVMPGKYQVTLEQDYLARKSLTHTGEASKTVDITHASDPLVMLEAFVLVAALTFSGR